MSRDHNLGISQNFFCRESYVRRLVEMSDISASDVVIEIGPGKGLITAVLASKARHVVAIELDPALVIDLEKKFDAAKNVEIIHADFIHWKLPPVPYKIFANIPFNLTSDVIRKLTSANPPATAAYLVMQREAVLRYIGQPHADETQVSILLKPWFEVSVITEIPASEFTPRPRVSILLAEFSPRARPLIDLAKAQDFRDFVMFGYSQWKQSLLDALAPIFSARQRTLMDGSIGLVGLRPTEVSIEKWLQMFEVYLRHVPEERKRLVQGTELRQKGKHDRMKKQHRTRSRLA